MLTVKWRLQLPCDLISEVSSFLEGIRYQKATFALFALFFVSQLLTNSFNAVYQVSLVPNVEKYGNCWLDNTMLVTKVCTIRQRKGQMTCYLTWSYYRVSLLINMLYLLIQVGYRCLLLTVLVTTTYCTSDYYLLYLVTTTYCTQ